MFTIYSKDNCPYCEKIKQLMTLAKIENVVYSLGRDFSREQFYAEFGKGSTFPQVVYENEVIGGCNETIEYLKENHMV